jgi:hypothetical protein
VWATKVFKIIRIANVRFDFEDTGHGVVFLFRVWKVQFSCPVILFMAMFLHGFPQSTLTDTKMVPQISHDRFLAHHLQLFIH